MSLPSGLRVLGGAIIWLLSMGSGEGEIEKKAEMRDSSAGVKFHSDALLSILPIPKEKFWDSYQPNNGSIEDLGSKTSEMGYVA